jgi:hypothetical protein
MPIPPPRDIPEIETWALGPAARAFEGPADAAGRFSVTMENRPPRVILLGREFAGESLAGVSTPGMAVFFRLSDSERLAAMAFFAGEETASLVFPAGGGEPAFIDGNGARRPAENISGEAARLGGRALMDAEGETLGFSFLMTPDNREMFASSLLAFAPGGRLIRLELWFVAGGAAGGAFSHARLTVQDKETQKLLDERRLSDFPLIFPTVRARRRAERLARAGASPSDSVSGFPFPRDSASPRDSVSSMPPRFRPGAAASAIARHEIRQKPLAPTAHLAPAEMVDAIQAEPDPERQRRMVVENLALLKPERAFRLLGRFAEAIQEETASWSAERVAQVFAGQPPAALRLVMSVWSNDVIAALAEGHPQREEFLSVWRELEIERLMEFPAGDKFLKPDDARRLLRVSPAADAQAIKKVWRTLLGFLNADFGRQSERGIHRKKDEIAKRLHQAREILAKKGS